MKRKALLVGNSHGLEGVKLDLINLRQFLESNAGGGWYSGEIELYLNVRRSTLLERIQSIKREANDFVVVMFSGHGEQKRQTVLELNKEQESIGESELRDLAPRQISIFDCCRAVQLGVQDSKSIESREFSLKEQVSTSSRAKYEKRMMEADPQQTVLYSCSIGQYSYDSNQGAIYLQNFLKTSGTQDGDFKLVSVAHQEAKILTEQQVKREQNRDQNPDASIAKLPSSRQLIISIKTGQMIFG